MEIEKESNAELVPATGTARVVVGMTFMWLAAVSFVMWFVFSREADGLLLLATLFLLGFFWAAGVFSKVFWSR